MPTVTLWHTLRGKLIQRATQVLKCLTDLSHLLFQGAPAQPAEAEYAPDFSVLSPKRSSSLLPGSSAVKSSQSPPPDFLSSRLL